MEKRQYEKSRALRHLVSMPFIWGMIVPIMAADLFLELYHRVCFPLYGIPYVSRREYIRVIDRAKLPYLSFLEKLGCAYCGYANGFLHYASVIAAKTEQYWCGIKHLEDRGYRPAPHEAGFSKYGAKEDLEKQFPTEKS